MCLPARAFRRFYVIYNRAPKLPLLMPAFRGHFDAARTFYWFCLETKKRLSMPLNKSIKVVLHTEYILYCWMIPTNVMNFINNADLCTFTKSNYIQDFYIYIYSLAIHHLLLRFTRTILNTELIKLTHNRNYVISLHYILLLFRFTNPQCIIHKVRSVCPLIIFHLRKWWLFFYQIVFASLQKYIKPISLWFVSTKYKSYCTRSSKQNLWISPETANA